MLQWDRTHKWEIQRCSRHYARVAIVFKGPVPSRDELIALRKCLPRFRHVPPAELRATLGSSGSLHLGVMCCTEERRLVEAAQSHGLIVCSDDASYTEDIPVDLTTGEHWWIEDKNEVAIVVQAMIAEGVPISPVEVD
jgi:hypothetical protein